MWATSDWDELPEIMLLRDTITQFKFALEGCASLVPNGFSSVVYTADVVPLWVYDKQPGKSIEIRVGMPVIQQGFGGGSITEGYALPPMRADSRLDLRDRLYKLMHYPQGAVISDKTELVGRRGCSAGHHAAVDEDYVVMMPHNKLEDGHRGVGTKIQHLPSFDATLSKEDAEQLLGYLTVPAIAIPLVLQRVTVPRPPFVNT